MSYRNNVELMSSGCTFKRRVSRDRSHDVNRRVNSLPYDLRVNLNSFTRDPAYREMWVPIPLCFPKQLFTMMEQEECVFQDRGSASCRVLSQVQSRS